MNEIALLSCPFCGYEDVEIMHTEGTVLHPHFYVSCGNCGVKGQGSDRGNHINNWNTRATVTPSDWQRKNQQDALQRARDYEEFRPKPSEKAAALEFINNHQLKYETAYDGMNGGDIDPVDKAIVETLCAALQQQDDGELVKALEFYSDPNHVEYDDGKIARDAIEAYKAKVQG